MKIQDSQLSWEQLELFPLMEKPYDVPLITPLIKENTNDEAHTS